MPFNIAFLKLKTTAAKKKERKKCELHSPQLQRKNFFLPTRLETRDFLLGPCLFISTARQNFTIKNTINKYPQTN
jgi:hypothetical protein